MSPIDRLIVPEVLSDADTIAIKELFSAPVMQKYLRILGINDSTELLTLSSFNLSDPELAKRHAFVSGKLSVITTLLSIPASN